MSKDEIVVHQGKNDLMPALSLQEANMRFTQMNQFVAGQMKKDVDFGKIPGTVKNTLYKPGAEKLTTFFGLTVKFIDEAIVEDFDKPLFFYRRKCQLWRGDLLIAEASGSCNSMEDRYAWRWVKGHEVPPELDRSKLATRVSSIGEWGVWIEKRQTTGQYGKPEEYWKKFEDAIKAGAVKKESKKQPWGSGANDVYYTIEDVIYRIPNENIFTLVNTVLKMADKRALVAATLIGCNASEFFTQDMEDIIGTGFDYGDGGDVIDIEATESKPEKPAGKQQKKVDTTSLKSDDLKQVLYEAGALASAGDFPLTEFAAFCAKLGFRSETTKIKKDFNDDVNAAVLHLINLAEEPDALYSPPSQDEIPF